MKKLFLVYLLLCSIMSFGQIEASLKLGQIHIPFKPNSNMITIVNTDSTTVEIKIGGDSSLLYCSSRDNYTDTFIDSSSQIKYSIDCKENSITFLPDNEKFIACNGVFVRNIEDCEEEEGESIFNNTDPTQIPFPTFTYNDDSSLPLSQKKCKNRNRYLIIDANPNPFQKRNNVLYKQVETKVSSKTNAGGYLIVNNDDYKQVNGITQNTYLKEVCCIHVNSSISVFIKNYQFNQVKGVTVSINGSDYSYDADIGDMYNQLANPAKEDTSASTGDSGNAISINPVKIKKNKNATKDYLDEVHTTLSTNKYLNSNDLAILQAYKDTLLKAIAEQNKQGYKLNIDGVAALSKILSWFPEYLSLTPIALAVPDADEVKIKVSLKKEGEDNPKEYDVGTFRTMGGLGIAVDNMVFITGLKNNKTYVDSIVVDTARNRKEARALLSNKNQLSLGVGVNAEISFRTCSIVRPIITAGFFIPFNEDVSPFFTVGSGISIGTKKVKLSLSGGVAFGSVNVIGERYLDKDLSQFSDSDLLNITEKVWKPSWQLAIGVSYNLANTK